MITAKQLAEATQTVKERAGDVVVDMTLLWAVFKEAENLEDEPKKYTVEEIQAYLTRQHDLGFTCAGAAANLNNTNADRLGLNEAQSSPEGILQWGYEQYEKMCKLRKVIPKTFNKWHKAVTQH